jgi:phosphonoacetate hydrolase
VSRKRAIVFVFDGLRPDRIDPVRMPHLARFRAQAVWYRGARTVFPSETRVAAASLVTGTPPSRHGLTANDFYDPAIFPDRPIATGNAGDLAAVAAARGRLLGRRTLAERVRAAGLRYAAVSTASAGTSRIVAEGADGPDAFVWSKHPGIATPGAADRVTARFGAAPAPSVPRAEEVRHAGRIFVETALEEFGADVALFWSGEPDSAYHYRGIGSPEAAGAENAADAAFGDVLDWLDRTGEADRTAVFALSDHGHITGRRKLDTATLFGDGGIRVARGAPAVGEIVLVPGSGAFVYRAHPNADADAALADWLVDQPWCGAVFADGRDGSATWRDLGIDGPAQPALAFTMRADMLPDAQGIVGGSDFDADLPEGCGMHGGLHPLELANTFVARIPGASTGVADDTPISLLDVAPAICDWVGVAAGDMAGCGLGRRRAETPPPQRTMLYPWRARGGQALGAALAGENVILDGLQALR